MSYKDDILIAEEIANQIGGQVNEQVEISLKEARIGQADVSSDYAKTEEARPRFPHIINHYLKDADVWYEIKFPRVGVKAWALRCRTNHDINYCFEPSHSTYMTLTKGATLTEDTAPEGVNAIYIKCSAAEVTIELELWREE